MLGQTREGLEKGGEKELEAIVVGEKEKEWTRMSSFSRRTWWRMVKHVQARWLIAGSEIELA